MSTKPQNPSKAYWHGWKDGRHGELMCFTDNPRLTELTAPSDRLDCYRGHRAGRETRLCNGYLLEAS